MAKSLNQVTLMGNLTRDPELKSTPSGQSVCSFTLALNSSYKNNAGEWVETASYVDCVAWGPLAERVSQWLFKGNPVLLSGKLQSRSWEQDGQKRSKLEVVAGDVVFIKNNSDQQTRSTDTVVSDISDEPIDLSQIPF